MKDMFKFALLCMILFSHKLYSEEQQESAFIKGPKNMLSTEIAIAGGVLGIIASACVSDAVKFTTNFTLQSISSDENSENITIFSNLLAIATTIALGSVYGRKAGCMLNSYMKEHGFYEVFSDDSSQEKLLRSVGWAGMSMSLCTGFFAKDNSSVAAPIVICGAMYSAFVAAAAVENYKQEHCKK